jgi:LDH2 family malate/lactate/ureidoglycolate dehydrogenase
VVVLLGVGNLVLHRAQHPMPVTLWTWLAIVAGAVTVLFTISRVVPVARRPHRE